MATVLLPRAPIAQTFISVEGECSRVGEMTGFVIIGNGRHRTVPEALNMLAPNLYSAEYLPRVVVDPCEAMWFDWLPFAEKLVETVGTNRAILETRGERGNPLGCPTYLLYTPGFTKMAPSDMRAGDEVKMLAHSVDEVRRCMELLAPYASEGTPAFVFARMNTVSETREGFEAFMQEHASKRYPRQLRMMLLEHEVVGIK